MQRLCLFFFLLISVNGEAFANKVPIVTPDHIYQEYLCLLNHREVLKIKDFSGECSNRNTVEIILIQQMMMLGGFDNQFVLEPGYYNQRERKLIKEGLLLISVDSLWENEAKSMAEDVFISPPIIKAGQYIAGFYTVESNSNAKAVSSIEQLKQLTLVSSKKWTNDWRVLSELGLTKLLDEPVWNAQAKMVIRKLADAMLMPFSNRPDLSYVHLDTRFIPIKNLYITLPESRHIIVSKKHPLGKKAYEALLKGMAILREQGIIEKAYKQAGVLNEQVMSWQHVNSAH